MYEIENLGCQGLVGSEWNEVNRLILSFLWDTLKYLEKPILFVSQAPLQANKEMIMIKKKEEKK